LEEQWGEEGVYTVMYRGIQEKKSIVENMNLEAEWG
jgi:hypothetical protein